jgi:hypothetical protein
MNEPQSPVDVIISIRKELKEFQQTSSPQALRAEWKAGLRLGLRLGGQPDEIIEYLKHRGLIRATRKLRAAREKKLRELQQRAKPGNRKDRP